MCTALSIRMDDHYFGRNLDLDGFHGEQVVVTPRNFPLKFRKMGALEHHPAFIGMALVLEGVPLYYDGANEHGLCMAGLYFPGNARYFPEQPGKDNVSPFELIPWVLGQCVDLAQARALLEKMNLVDIPFSGKVSLTPMHWIVSDGFGSLVIESEEDGLHLYDDPLGIMTNNPPFPQQMFNLNHYSGLSPENPRQSFWGGSVEQYCQGLGALGLPGDVSSMSRFVRMAYHACSNCWQGDEHARVGQFFHLLGSVEMVRGACRTAHGWDITAYSSCMNPRLGRYYYATYENHGISCVDMHRCDLDAGEIFTFSLMREEQIRFQN